ncbi:MAG: hypothetical protein QOF91_2303 [Alphaproteobacteria bacterium]|nr:hypothetical protein [Alphaproteobacteria bacterium]
MTTMKIAFAAVLIAASCGIALAQPAQTMRVRGTIEKVDGNTLTLKTADGEAKLTLSGDAQVVAVVKASMADIKENTFLGSAAMPQPDGTQKAMEVHIFPEAMRGTGEGHRPYAPVKDSTMTNGTAAGTTVTEIDGSVIKVKYKDGEKTIIVPPNTPIVRFEIGGPADLRPGAAFTVTAATKRPDGTLEATRINVGRDGMVPQ